MYTSSFMSRTRPESVRAPTRSRMPSRITKDAPPGRCRAGSRLLSIRCGQPAGYSEETSGWPLRQVPAGSLQNGIRQRGSRFCVVARRVGELLRDRRIFGGRAHRAAIRGDGAGGGDQAAQLQRNDRCLRHPDDPHFAFVLLLASIVAAPWPTLSSAAIAIGACGLVGVVYVCIVIRRTRRQSGYAPVLEDWIWHIVLPLAAYAALAAAAFALTRHPLPSLFVVGASSLLLLFAGIHNAWDTVTYVLLDQQAPGRE